MYYHSEPNRHGNNSNKGVPNVGCSLVTEGGNLQRYSVYLLRLLLTGRLGEGKF